jgi:DNA polymerase
VKRSEAGGALDVHLVANPDVAAETRCARKPGAVSSGFALETDGLVENAREKLSRERLRPDRGEPRGRRGGRLRVGDEPGHPGRAAGIRSPLPMMDKDAVADVVLDRVEALLAVALSDTRVARAARAAAPSARGARRSAALPRGLGREEALAAAGRERRARRRRDRALAARTGDRAARDLRPLRRRPGSARAARLPLGGRTTRADEPRRRGRPAPPGVLAPRVAGRATTSWRPRVRLHACGLSGPRTAGRLQRRRARTRGSSSWASAPGQNEDETGLSVRGAAGKLLDLLLMTVDLSRRETVYICNVLKCRPPGNRNPLPDEIEACRRSCERQIEIVSPEVILAWARSRRSGSPGPKRPLGSSAAAVYSYRGVPLVVTYHPAAILRNQGWTRATWDDFQLLRQVLDPAPDRSELSPHNRNSVNPPETLALPTDDQRAGYDRRPPSRPRPRYRSWAAC